MSKELWLKLVHPEDKTSVIEIFENAIKSKQENYTIELRLQHKDGHYVSVLWRGFITQDDNENVTRVTGTNQNLLEYKQSRVTLSNTN